MCTGMEIAALAAAVGGAGLSAAGSMRTQNEMEANQRRMADARNEKLNATLAKNDKLAQDSRTAFNERQQRATADNLEQDRQDQTDKRETTLEQSVSDAPAAAQNVSLSGSAPSVVRSEMAKRLQSTMSEGKDQAKRLATLGGYGDSWLNQGFQDVGAGRDISQNANFASGNLSILPYQQDIAEMRAYKPISSMGGLMQGFGSVLSSAGGSKFGGATPKRSYTTPY